MKKIIFFLLLACCSIVFADTTIWVKDNTKNSWERFDNVKAYSYDKDRHTITFVTYDGRTISCRNFILKKN